MRDQTYSVKIAHGITHDYSVLYLKCNHLRVEQAKVDAMARLEQAWDALCSNCAVKPAKKPAK